MLSESQLCTKKLESSGHEKKIEREEASEFEKNLEKKLEKGG